ncbi:alginate export family protein [Bosea sp. 2KB_26]|uniref:alginate export family protein n=1 Tax=Bosea sp. 2KB_26 TaxID=3237475 RepID=UPI003F8F9C99
MRNVTRPDNAQMGRSLAIWAGLLLLGAALPAQADPAEAPKFTPPGYKLFRYDEDYRYLRDPANRTDLWDPVKYIPLGGVDSSWYLGFGGELRARYEYYSNPNLGLQGQKPNGYLLPRVLLHADLHAGEYLRAFVQFGSHLAPWKDFPAPPYLDRADLQQAFIDLRLPLGDNVERNPFLRIGRQEMAFGSQRLVSIRDAPNVRRNFDGFRLSATLEGTSLDAFVTRPVLQRRDSFDDASNHAQAFWGLYATVPLNIVTGGRLDLYYLGFENERARYANAAGEERRHTLGSRFFGAAAGWDWDWEILGQVGTIGQQDIRAWGLSTDTGYTLDLAGGKFRLGLKADIGSGDKNATDGTLGTLNPLFPKLAYFNQAALLGPSNVMDLQPTLSFKPTSNLTFSVGYDFLWRNTTADAVYTGAGAPIAGTAGRPGRFTGRQLTVDASWQLNRHIQLDAGYVHLDAASSLRRAGGHDVDFTYLSAAYKF